MGRKVASATALFLLGSVVLYMGLEAMPHGRVAGGNLIWVMLFGGCVLLYICAYVIIRDALK